MSDQPPFRFTPQVGIVIAIVLLALATPLALVGLYFRKTPEPAPVNPPDTSAILAPMAQTLEALADRKLAGGNLTLNEDSVIQIVPKSGETVRQCSDRLLRAVERSNGTALETSSAENGGPTSWIVTIPKSRAGEFRRLIMVSEINDGTINPESKGEGTEFFRLEIVRPDPEP